MVSKDDWEDQMDTILARLEKKINKSIADKDPAFKGKFSTFMDQSMDIVRGKFDLDFWNEEAVKRYGKHDIGDEELFELANMLFRELQIYFIIETKRIDRMSASKDAVILPTSNKLFLGKRAKALYSQYYKNIFDIMATAAATDPRTKLDFIGNIFAPQSRTEKVDDGKVREVNFDNQFNNVKTMKGYIETAESKNMLAHVNDAFNELRGKQFIDRTSKGIKPPIEIIGYWDDVFVTGTLLWMMLNLDISNELVESDNYKFIRGIFCLEDILRDNGETLLALIAQVAILCDSKDYEGVPSQDRFDDWIMAFFWSTSTTYEYLHVDFAISSYIDSISFGGIVNPEQKDRFFGEDPRDLTTVIQFQHLGERSEFFSGNAKVILQIPYQRDHAVDLVDAEEIESVKQAAAAPPTTMDGEDMNWDQSNDPQTKSQRSALRFSRSIIDSNIKPVLNQVEPQHDLKVSYFQMATANEATLAKLTKADANGKRLFERYTDTFKSKLKLIFSGSNLMPLPTLPEQYHAYNDRCITNICLDPEDWIRFLIKIFKDKYMQPYGVVLEEMRTLGDKILSIHRNPYTLHAHKTLTDNESPLLKLLHDVLGE